MPEYLYPGVYVEEVDTGNKPIEGVSTSTVGFLGITERGPLAPTLITSYSEFVRLYGTYYNEPPTAPATTATPRYLAYAVEGFFQNGGRRCFVARVAGASGGTASVPVDSKLTFTALGPGAGGSRIAVRTQQQDGGRFRVYVMYFKDAPPTPLVDPTDPANASNANRREPTVLEVFEDLSDSQTSSSFYERKINGLSTLVTVKRDAAGVPANTAATVLTGGTDDNSYVLSDFTGSAVTDPTKPIGLDALKAIDEISILCCPDEESVSGVTGALRDQCELMKDRFAILNPPLTPPAIASHQPSLNSKYAAYYYPWLKVIDPLSGQTVLVPPGGHLAGIYARSDAERGVHKDPANEVIRGIDSLQVQISKEQQAILNPRGVNALRYFTGAGNLVWGGRTTSRDPDWKYINVRRLFIFVEKSIERGTQWVVFEPNDEPTWARVRRSVGDFLTRLWMDGMLQGRTAEQAYFVKCDRTTMTQADIDNGRLICLIGIAPVKPAEFVIFRIGQWTGGSEVSEV